MIVTQMVCYYWDMYYVSSIFDVLNKHMNVYIRCLGICRKTI